MNGRGNKNRTSRGRGPPILKRKTRPQIIFGRLHPGVARLFKDDTLINTPSAGAGGRGQRPPELDGDPIFSTKMTPFCVLTTKVNKVFLQQKPQDSQSGPIGGGSGKSRGLYALRRRGGAGAAPPHARR